MSKRQEELYRQAGQYLPGGVCSSARVHKSLGQPVYISRAEGGRVYDVGGAEYIDLFMSFGAGLLGHGHPAVKAAITEGVALGFPAAYENEYQIRLACQIAQIIPCVDMVRFTLSGTETTYYTVKLARQYTGRAKVIKFEGHFHGFNEQLAYNYWPAPQAMWPAITPAMAGLPDPLHRNTLVLPFNDEAQLEATLAAQGHEIAAVILEPLNYNSGVIEPLPGYLEKLRRLTTEHGIVLIFDEILSNFRTGPGCIQAYYGVTPDLCTLGKVLAGGLALSAFGGRREIMAQIAPLGEVQHSGTFNALWLPIMAGTAAVGELSRPEFYAALLPRCQRLYDGINEIMNRRGFPGRVQGVGARCAFLFGRAAEKPRLINYRDFAENDIQLALRFYGAALQHGLYMHSAYHHGISAMHTDADIALALERLEAVVIQIMREGLGQPASAAESHSLF
jgi:glutamate-1-semialdehyde 2,1-aminomutase